MKNVKEIAQKRRENIIRELKLEEQAQFNQLKIELLTDIANSEDYNAVWLLKAISVALKNAPADDYIRYLQKELCLQLIGVRDHYSLQITQSFLDGLLDNENC